MMMMMEGMKLEAQIVSTHLYRVIVTGYSSDSISAPKIYRQDKRINAHEDKNMKRKSGLMRASTSPQIGRLHFAGASWAKSALEQNINSNTRSNKRLIPNDQLTTPNLVVKVEHGQLLRLSCGFLWRPTTPTTQH